MTIVKLKKILKNHSIEIYFDVLDKFTAEVIFQLYENNVFCAIDFREHDVLLFPSESCGEAQKQRIA